MASSIEDRTASFGNSVSEEDRFGRDSKRETQQGSTPKSSDTRVTTISVTPKAAAATQHEENNTVSPGNPLKNLIKRNNIPLYLRIDSDKVIPEEPNSAFKLPEESGNGYS